MYCMFRICYSCDCARRSISLQHLSAVFAFSVALELLKKFSKTIHRLGGSILHPLLERFVSIFDRLENIYDGHRCLTVLLFKHRRFKHYMAWHTFEFKSIR
jgi:hypothetical protein